jgi:sigma-B regulation protein RsbU (phosphoserine phosphatase)
MAIDLFENTKNLVAKEKLEGEMKLAGKIQQDSIPKEIPVVNGLEIAAKIVPAEEVGGDIYDFISHEEDKVLFYFGDATGHGVPAGLIVSIVTALVLNYSMEKKSTTEILSKLNYILYRKTSMDMFMTMAMMFWNNKTKTMKYTMGGHEQIILFTPGQSETTLLPSGGIAIGMMQDVGPLLKEQEIKPLPGQVMAIYSDGIPEAWDPERKNIFGMEAFQKSIHVHCLKKDSIQDIHTRILSEVENFMGGSLPEDDVSLILVRFN